MKRAWKVIAVLSLGTALALSGCGGGDKEYTGEYHYKTEYDDYGVKVEVEVRGGIIKDVDVVKSDYTEVTSFWEGKDNYYAHREGMLEAFEGKTVEEVLSYTVSCDSDGTPNKIDANGLQLVTGATQCSGRLLLAVQNALKKVKD